MTKSREGRKGKAAGKSVPPRKTDAAGGPREGATKPAHPTEEEMLDETSDESFPASDPPAWTDTSASKNDS